MERRVVVIGAGAAGYFAAIHAAHQGARVHLLERTGKTLAKVAISGGGRCNVTHDCLDPALLASHYPRGSRELLGAFHRFHAAHTIDWFEARGVDLKVEPDGRMFPTTDHSGTIIDCLEREAQASGVALHLHCAVTALQPPTGDRKSWLVMTERDRIEADAVIVTIGGQPKAQGFHWLEALGITIVPPVPSLFTFNLPQAKELRTLMGLATPAQVTLPAFNRTESGPVLVTHWGLSGPAVIRLSAWLARELANAAYRADVLVNWATQPPAQVLALLKSARDASPGKQVRNHVFEPLPRRLWEYLVWRANLPERLAWGQAGNKHLQALCDVLCRDTYRMEGKTTFKDEFVTAGGVALDQVDFRTMQVRHLPGLYMAGEVLDVDGITGGFNFQAAWTTGYLAGTAAGQGK